VSLENCLFSSAKLYSSFNGTLKMNTAFTTFDKFLSYEKLFEIHHSYPSYFCMIVPRLIQASIIFLKRLTQFYSKTSKNKGTNLEVFSVFSMQ